MRAWQVTQNLREVTWKLRALILSPREVTQGLREVFWGHRKAISRIREAAGGLGKSLGDFGK